MNQPLETFQGLLLGQDYLLVYGANAPSLAQANVVWREEKPGAREILVEYRRLRGVFGDDHVAVEFGIRAFYSAQPTVKELRNLLPAGDFPNPKDPEVIGRLLRYIADDRGALLDFFAGSGTTGHAVINLNREDGGRRKFILVEMANYFETVLLPRMKKVTFTPEWKEGKPKRMATAQEAERSPRIAKCIRLESYEDALNNIAFDDDAGQQAMKSDDCVLQYMPKWETRASETLLNVEKLSRPFHYRLHLHLDGRTSGKPVDIPETFNYLLGLHVQTRQVHADGGRSYLVYRGRVEHRNIAVIWRDTEGWQKAGFERDREFVGAQGLADGVEEVFVNGDALIAEARALEPVFKARMFAEVEAGG
jgi:adenine-specific DNA-methyltransferase